MVYYTYIERATMARVILIAVVVLSFLVAFSLKGSDAIWAFGYFLITLAWLMQWDKFEKEAPLSEDVKIRNMLGNLFYLIIAFLIFRFLFSW
jgi:lysylphosphatidylglycerol synthetase-like protein (DUF2156 family)